MAEPFLNALLVAPRFEVRGSCATTLRLLERLPAAGVKVDLVCPNAQLIDPVRRKKLPIREVPWLEVPVLRRVALRGLGGAPGAKVPDVIHVQSRRMLWAATHVAKRLAKPLVLTIHDYLRPRERLRLDQAVCRKIIAVSDAVRNDLLARTGLPSDLVTVVASGVETVFDEIRMPLVPDHVPVIGTAGPLESAKGFPYFLGAARHVLLTGRDVEFLVAGAGPEEANLRRLARTLGIAHKVTFVPYLLDFRHSLEAMDIFCLPSLQQGLGTVMLQAMALGRPVIASGVGGVHTIVREGETGLLAPPSNSAELAARMIDLLENPVRARAIGEAARRLVEAGFSVEQMVQKVVAVYSEVTGLSRMPAAISA
jgi:glycosyltransferase involved in cell wall biosynthesis